jgi:hypothetical protein
MQVERSPKRATVADSPDENVIINHRHPAAAAIRIERVEGLDIRLLWPVAFPRSERPRRSARRPEALESPVQPFARANSANAAP